MSGIAVIFNRDRRPVEFELLTKMLTAMEHRGPHGLNQWSKGPVGFGHAMLATTPEALGENQPLRDPEARLCLTFDGRVDNREELGAALEAKGFHLRDNTDAELVLRAYECWGESSPERIIGDFAYAIWDDRRGKLFCVRDPLGVKPFYFFADENTFLAASEPHQILACPRVPHEPNEGMIAEYLAADLHSRDETFFRNIHRLPAAHMMVVDQSRVSTRRYFDLLSSPDLRYSNDRQYSERFLEIFTDAVRCRLRSVGTIAVALSGGLDSSAVAAIAQGLTCERTVSAPGLEAFSFCYSEPKADERFYINEVLRHCALSSRMVEDATLNIEEYLEEVRRYKDVASYPNGSALCPLIRRELGRDVRVVLTGVGGDEWLTGTDLYYADLLRNLRIRELFGMARSKTGFGEYGRAQTHNSFRVLANLAVRPLLARVMPRKTRRVLRKVRGYRSFPLWIDARFAKRTSLEDRLERTYYGANRLSFAQQAVHDMFQGAWLAHANEIRERSASWSALEERDPFLDRRVLEFCFGIPEKQRYRNEQTKYVLRNAICGMVPETVRTRRTKAELSHLFAQALEAFDGTPCSQFEVTASMGWVDAEAAGHAWHQTLGYFSKGDVRYSGQNLWALWMALVTEMWSETVLSRRSIFGKFPASSTLNPALH